MPNAKLPQNKTVLQLRKLIGSITSLIFRVSFYALKNNLNTLHLLVFLISLQVRRMQKEIVPKLQSFEIQVKWQGFWLHAWAFFLPAICPNSVPKNSSVQSHSGYTELMNEKGLVLGLLNYMLRNDRFEKLVWTSTQNCISRKEMWVA